MNIVGTKEVMAEIKRILYLNNKISRKPHNKAYHMFIGGSKVIARVVQYLYNGATICLNRKLQKATQISSSTNCRLHWEQCRVLLSELLGYPEDISATAWPETASRSRAWQTDTTAPEYQWPE